MAIPEIRRLRNQMAGLVRQYEAHLLRLEKQLQGLREKVQRAGEDTQVKLSGLLAQAERDVEAAREMGRTALTGLERATDAARACVAELKGRFADVRVRVPSAVARGRAVVHRAAIEAKALRQGVRVGLRVARSGSRRSEATKE